MKIIFLLLGVGVIVSGCAASRSADKPLYFKKDGATQEELMKDRYTCYQETKQMVSNAYANQHGGGVSARVMPSCSGFAACLAARGYLQANSDTANLLVPRSAGIACSK